MKWLTENRRRIQRKAERQTRLERAKKEEVDIDRDRYNFKTLR